LKKKAWILRGVYVNAVRLGTGDDKCAGDKCYSGSGLSYNKQPIYRLPMYHGLNADPMHTKLP